MITRRISPELAWLTAGMTLCVLPHTLHIPLWASLLYGVLLALRIALPESTVRRLFVRAHLYRFAVAGLIFTGVFTSYGTMVGRDAGVTLLVLLGGLKLLEVRGKRDCFISVYIGFLLILTAFFYTQTLPVSLYMAVAAIVLIATLISINEPTGAADTGRRLQAAAWMMIHALPLMVLMFVLFPRASGPLWGLPKDAQSGITGIDDEMSPGSISELILSDEVAFRVSFEGTIPDKSSLYWRGPVLWYTDGFKWVPNRPAEPAVRLLTAGEPSRYTVTLEAHDKNWLYGLDMPSEAAGGSYLNQDLQLRTTRPVTQRLRYDLTSYTDYLLVDEDPAQLENALQLPAGYHPRTIALAESWRGEGLDATQMVERALDHFNRQNFYYTLAPPLFINDSVDEFMFDSRQGFCEHYAAAFTILMRAAGIPARVVTGYQGGTVNRIGQYLIVYHRDAHAWTEVWLGAERGWVRVDPTSAVSPARVTDGIQGALPESLITIPRGIYNNSFARGVWERVSNTFDAINNRWNQWVLGYDRTRQRQFLNNFGLGGLGRDELMVSMIVILTVCLAVIAFGLLYRQQLPTDEARRWYDRYRRKLARSGIEIRDQEGPRDLAQRAIQARQDLGTAIARITALYIDVRYRNRAESLERLREEVRAFRPARTS